MMSRWNIPDEILQNLPQMMADIAMNEEINDRARINAAKLIVQMNSTNIGNKTSVSVAVASNADTGKIVQAMVNEPGYVGYLETVRQDESLFE